MARFNGPGPAASAHAAMMRAVKAGKGSGSGCAIFPFAIIIAGSSLLARFIT